MQLILGCGARPEKKRMNLARTSLTLTFLLMVPFAVLGQPKKIPSARSFEGSVVGKEEGARWIALVVESRGTRYVIPLGLSPTEYNPTTTGDVERIGAQVRVSYRKFERRSDGSIWVDALRVVTVEGPLTRPNASTNWTAFWRGFR